MKMTNQPTKLIVDLSKPKGQRESYVPLTKDEIAQNESDALASKARLAEEEAILAQKAADAQAGRDALVALGLTEAQITALVGS
jgi:hypothetical protein